MKKAILLSITLFVASYAWALTVITTGTISGSPFCGGAVVGVPYTVDAPANANNIFTAQLSDKNGSFAAPVIIGTIAKKGAGTIAATIPSGTASGTKYRIRVVSSSPVVMGSPNTVNLAINPQPVGVKINTITACDAQLKWNSQANASGFDVRYKLSSSSDWSSTINVGLATTYSFITLKASSNYDFSVRAKCANGNKSTWKQVSGSTTAPVTPTGLTVTAIGITTSTLDWADAACAASYRVRYKELTASNWQVYKTAATSTLGLTGLFPATDYVAQVATITSSNDSSAYTTNASWQTNYFKLASGNEVSAFTVFPNPSEGTFTVQMQSQNDYVNSEITVQNIYGQIVYSELKNFKSGLNEEVISIPNAIKGMYLVRVRTGETISESALTIQ